MSNAANDNHSGSFSHAFLPGLILGLVIGAVAGAFLPDFIGGSKIPTPSGEITPRDAGPRDGETPMTEEDIQGLIDEAEDAAEDTADQAGDAADDLLNDAETPPSGG